MPDPQPVLYLAAPRGFCAGVDRAIDIVEMALQVYGPPVWVRHEIVHNRHVVEDLRRKGAVFTDDLAEVPAGAVVIFSAHGVSPAVRMEARERGLKALDATCPLVTKVHLEALRHAKDGTTIVLVGHRHHVEVQGTLGEAPDAIVVVVSEETGAISIAKDGKLTANIDEETLKTIASITRGEYFYAGTAADLRKVYESLSTRLVLEKKQTEITALFAAAAAALALVSAVLSLLWFNRIL